MSFEVDWIESLNARFERILKQTVILSLIENLHITF